MAALQEPGLYAPQPVRLVDACRAALRQQLIAVEALADEL